MRESCAMPAWKPPREIKRSVGGVDGSIESGAALHDHEMTTRGALR
jgi:hypothetical protein